MLNRRELLFIPGIIPFTKPEVKLPKYSDYNPDNVSSGAKVESIYVPGFLNSFMLCNKIPSNDCGFIFEHDHSIVYWIIRQIPLSKFMEYNLNPKFDGGPGFEFYKYCFEVRCSK